MPSWILEKNLVKHSNLYVGKLARVNEIYSDESASSIKKINHQNGGCARAELLEWVDSDEIDKDEDNDQEDNGNAPAKKRKRDASSKTE